MPIWCDLDRSLGVVGPTDATTAQYRFFQNDTISLVLHGLRENTSSVLAGSPYETASIEWNKLVATLSLVDAAPAGGTFKVRVTGVNLTYEDTPELESDVLKVDLEAALNGLALVSALGGVSVVEGGAPNIYRIQKTDPSAQFTFSVVENKLSPVCFCDVRVDPDTAGKCELKLYRAPVALTDAFSLPMPPAIAAPVRVRVGSATRNEVQRIIIPNGALGQFALDFNGLAGKLISVSGIKASGFAAALNDPYTAANSADIRFAVTSPTARVFDIEFIGAFAKTEQPLFSVEMFDQTPLDLPQAEMQITSLRVEDLLDTAASAGLLFEIAAFDSNGAKTTLIQQPVTIVNNAIDSSSITQAEQQPLLTRTETVYQYVDPSQPMLAGIFGHPFAPEDAAQDYTFIHDFGTWRPIVEVYRKTSEVPEVWTRVPSNHFTVEAVTANQVRVYGFDFEVEANKLHVDVIDPDARVLVNTHEHSTDQVYREINGVKTPLSGILDSLANILPTGWPNIPANKLSGTVSLDNLDIEAIAKSLSGSTNFPTTLKELFGDPAIAATVAEALKDSSTFADTLKALLATSDVAAVVSKALQGDSAFAAVIRDMFSTLLATGGVMPPGITLMQIADIDEQFPARIPATGTSAGLAPLLPSAVTGLTDKGELAASLPSAASSSGWKYTLSRATQAPQVRNLRPRQQFPAGSVVASDGRAWYIADIADQTAWPREMTRRILVLPLTETMFSPGSKFACIATFGVNLVGNCEGQYMFVLKTGVPVGAAGFGANLENVLWDDPLIEEPILLTSATVFHTFGLTLTHALDGTITGTATRYAQTLPLGAPLVGAKRIVYAALERFDTENTILPPIGQVSLKLKGAKASICPI